MKKVLASLLAAYTLTNAQPVDPVVIPPPPEPPILNINPPNGGSASSVTTGSPVIVEPAQVTTTPPVVVTAPVVTPSPTTPSPTTAAPTTSSPTTASPTTAAPTYNPYCPLPGALVSQHGVQAAQFGSSNAGCVNPMDIARDFNGKLQCSTFACCQCAEIRCGDPMGLLCDELVISDSGAVGNQNIKVLGDMASAFNSNNNFFGNIGIGGGINNGAQIRCNGLEACKGSRILGKYVGQLSCAGDMGCSGANIRIEDPGHEFQAQCNGMMSCMNTNLEIVITRSSQNFELQTIEFNGQQSAQGMTVTIINEGSGPVILQNLECMNPTACPNLRIDIQGQVMIENCDLQHMNINAASPSLLSACQAGQNFQGNFQGNFPPQQQFPPIGGFPGNNIPQVPYVPPQLPPQGPPVNPGPFTPPVTQPQQPLPPPPVTQPQVPPQVLPQPPVTQPQVPPAVVQPPPANPVAPVNPTVPVVPAPPANPGFVQPGFGGGFGFYDPNNLKCEFGRCRNQIINLIPAHGFTLTCDLPGQCDGMTLNLNVGAGGFGFMTEIYALKFSVPTRGVTININGMAEVNDIRCEVIGACYGLTITGSQIDMFQVNMDCQQPGACTGCTLNGQGCDYISAAQNHGGGGFGGYGTPYNVAPQYNTPQYPQYPQYNTPQYPQYPQYYPGQQQWI